MTKLTINSQLVTEITSLLSAIIRHLNATLTDFLTSYRVKILDGNAIASKNLCNR
ncbi:MAG: hypothetical protein V7L20_11550 [Nostoc sp.]|uniref:hypothetical protein n=1 Tax=Nostoc sp. TaxID=1180 RepID=UPI002FF61499